MCCQGRPFQPCFGMGPRALRVPHGVYISQCRERSQAVHTNLHTLFDRTRFAQSSHRIHSYSHTIRTLFARSHTVRTVAHYSHGRTLFPHYIRTVSHYWHTIRTVAHYLHTIRAVHTVLSPSSQQIEIRTCTIRTSSHPVHTIRAVGASPFAVFAPIHAVFPQFTPEDPFAFVNVRYVHSRVGASLGGSVPTVNIRNEIKKF